MNLLLGDCRDVMRTMPADGFDAIVTDPPYGLSFMGKGWDHGVPGVEFWTAALRVAKPGAHLLAFGGTRTYHRLMCAIEDAGFEIRDCIMWVYGSGFPKSHNLDGDREGWGTALKPAWEPIIVARKPLAGTVAENVQRYGTGAINVDWCRVGWSYPSEAAETDAKTRPNSRTAGRAQGDAIGPVGGAVNTSPLGRWPANLIHDGSEEVVALFPSEAGAVAPVHLRNGDKFRGTYGAFAGNIDEAGSTFHGDTGSAARFFKSCDHTDDEWLSILCGADIASASLSPQKVADAIAQSDAATSALPAGSRLSVTTAPSTSATARELRTLANSVIEAMQGIGRECLREWRHARLSPIGGRVNVAATRELIGTMTITASHWRSDGSADPVTFSITPPSSAPGEADFARRFIYCAKASREDRNEGCEGLPKRDNADWPQSLDGDDARGAMPSANNHPTVKPTDLMRYLVRLVTPPGGVVLDPFVGSGSTGKACALEDFGFVGIDNEPAYIEIARRRIKHAASQPKQQPLALTP